jgi:hypothetical protein
MKKWGKIKYFFQRANKDSFDKNNKVRKLGNFGFF